MANKYGINCYSGQGNIDWSQVSQSTWKDFALICAGRGQYTTDAYFNQNVNGCVQNRIDLGAWWFCYSYTIYMAEAEARLFCDTVEATGYNFTYPLFWDIEEDTIRYARDNGVTITTELMHHMFRAFWDIVTARGHNCGLYFNQSFYNTYNYQYLFDQYPLMGKWIAAPGLYPTPPSYPDFDIWQYDTLPANSVPGVSTSCDVNVIIDGYTPPTPPAPIPTIRTMPIWMSLRPPI